MLPYFIIIPLLSSNYVYNKASIIFSGEANIWERKLNKNEYGNCSPIMIHVLETRAIVWRTKYMRKEIKLKIYEYKATVAQLWYMH